MTPEEREALREQADAPWHEGEARVFADGVLALGAALTAVEAERDEARAAWDAASDDRDDTQARVIELEAALAPFVRNAWVVTDDASVRTYGDGYVFNRVALSSDGEETVWGFKIEDVARAALAKEDTDD